MGAIPHELTEWLPGDLPVADVVASAKIGRSFDRVHGEALVLRMRSGALELLTRSEAFDVFRALPLGGERALELVQGRELRLHARTVDGRLLTMPLGPAEIEPVRAVLGATITKSPSAPPRGTPSDRPPPPSDRPPSKGPNSDRPPRAASLRPPESGEAEVIRIPRSVRPAIGSASSAGATSPGSTAPGSTSPGSTSPGSTAPGSTAPGSIPSAVRPATPAPARPPSSPPRPESLRPPTFEHSAHEPAPIVRSARDIDALRARFRHHWERGELDEATEVARALVHMRVADGMEQRLAAQHPQMSPGFAIPLTPYLFRAYLAHDDEHADLGRLLAAIWPAYLQMRLKPERDLGLRPHDEVQLGKSDHPFAKLFAHAVRALGVPPLRLFLRTDVPGGMAHLHTIPIASLCGATLATGFDSPATLHVLGHHLSLTRPETYLLALVPTPADAHALVLAMLWLEGRAPAAEPRIGALAETLSRHMVPPVREAIRAACADLTLDGDPKAATKEALERFRRAAYLTAVRAGFALSGSLAVSDKMQRIMPAVHGLTIDEMIDDLVTYSVSPSWMALRKELGIALEPSTPNAPIV